ncbi:MAG: Peptide methionine sulfoxide reductase MsrB [candidate division WS6 bacterium OLB20]|uniref:Peptide methionine sulfoxide reductase MsrB n=1 Tax=candidate division WS6 bacterium OLB20 TaxID=1617426 RepID=A0A136LXM8_9BACT|nr:MAG: Peptide methionine sulfoxide reductase MsrB [candidate division WS6 bacterium OLB20]
MAAESLKDMPESYWRERLTPEEYKVLREQGTEAPFTGVYYDNHEDGMYRCKACGQKLFSSEHKFESGSGWPSFDRPLAEGTVELREDTSHGMVRTEVICSNCGSHLGHLFPDGPAETTGERFCINSCALAFDSDISDTLEK